MNQRLVRFAFGLALPGLLAALAGAGERIERFDKDPGWEGRNNRADEPKPRTVKQDFGYSRTAHAGGAMGEIGGLITPAAEPAYYAKKIDPKTLRDPLTASGRLMCKGPQFHALIGFLHSETINEWRAPNAISIRIQGRGDVFYAYVEYATSRWRAGADDPGGFATLRDPATGRANLRGFAIGTAVQWSLRYDPDGNNGGGSVSVTLGGETSVCHLGPGHKNDGATFNRFGLLPVSKTADTGGEVFLDDITIGDDKHDFARDPHWEGVGNRKTHESANVRPRFDFGFSPTRHAGGEKAGELGGLVFRGDCRYAGKIASYGDRLGTLTLDQPLRAGGKVCLRRGVSDSTTLLGFYHSEDSLKVTQSQSSGFPLSFLGVAIEGPSSEGFFFYPAYRVRGDGQGYADGPKRPRIQPDGKAHEWTLKYTPMAAAGRGQIEMTLGRESVKLDLGAGHRATGANFNRFGLVTTWIDGNGQHVYFDDLLYTVGK